MSEVRPGDVALSSPVVRESLPMPIVHYPNHYGVFMAFSRDESGPPALCACARPAVANCLALWADHPLGEYSNRLVNAPLSSHLFPDVLSAASMEVDEPPLRWLRFEEGLCHRCNLAVPALRYCSPTYGGKFRQGFGWYIRQAGLRLGVHFEMLRYVPETTPDEVAQMVDDAKQLRDAEMAEQARLIAIVKGPKRTDIPADEVTFWTNVRMDEASYFKDVRKSAGKAKRRLAKYLENIVRDEFGVRRVGEGWVSESLLAKVVQQMLPEHAMLRNHRPDWLQGLELDIFLPELNVALEYQGQQHYHPVSAWGGEKALRQVQERDARKREICGHRGVKLLEVHYKEPLVEDHIRRRLRVEAGILVK